jgi:DNA-binding protein H-NS
VMETELAMLEEMLRLIEVDRVIERESVEARRDRVRQELERLGPEDPGEPART